MVKKDIKTATRMLHAARVELQDANDRLVEVMVGASVAPAEIVRLMTRFVGEAKLQASGCAGARGHSAASGDGPDLFPRVTAHRLCCR